MTKIELSTHIQAPIARCFDLARSLELNTMPIANNIEHKLTRGLLQAGQRVQRVTSYLGFQYQSEIELKRCAEPYYFSDEMKVGPFHTFVHDHFFYAFPHETVMIDNVYFQSPWGILGETVDTLLIKRQVLQMLKSRNKIIKQYAEGDTWQLLIDNSAPRVETELSFQA
jgi:ligand-binding SRPBCC domain-containing protein